MKAFLNLMFPVVFTYLGITLMGFVDLLFVGRVSAAAMGAVGLGTSIFTWFLVFGLGLTSSLEYLVAHAHGAGDRDRQHYYLSQGLIVSVLMSLPLTFLMIFITSHLDWFGVNPDVLKSAEEYSLVVAFSLFPAYAFNVMRLYLTSLGLARPALFFLVFGNILNAMIDAAFVLGKWGAPALGAVGSAWATLGSRWAMFLGYAVYLYFWDRKNGNRLSRLKLVYQKEHMDDLVRLGFPAALQMIFEVGIFAASTLLAASLSSNYLAAHQIVLNIASMTFMVPLGVGAATAVLVGQAIGRKEPQSAVEAGGRGFRFGIGFMIGACFLLLFCADPILRFFTNDESILAIGKSILVIAAIFQMADGAQTVGTGALRGLGDTKSAMFLNLVGHWGVGLPVGAFLCFRTSMGLRGLWIGLSLGLLVVALGVLVQWIRKSRRI